MDGIVLPGEQETLEAEQGAQGEEGFRGGGAGDECAVSGYPLGILMEPPRDPGEKEDETKLVRRCRRAEEKGCMKILQKRERSERMPEFLSILRPLCQQSKHPAGGGNPRSRGATSPKIFSFLLSTELLRKILEERECYKRMTKKRPVPLFPTKRFRISIILAIERGLPFAS